MVIHEQARLESYVHQSAAIWNMKALDPELTRLELIVNGEAVAEEVHTPLNIEEWRQRMKAEGHG